MSRSHLHWRLFRRSEPSAIICDTLRVDTVVRVRVGCTCAANSCTLIGVRIVLETAINNRVLNGVTTADADTRIVLLTLDG